MHGIEMHGGWREQDDQMREYSLALFDSPEKLLDFYDILTRDRWEYLPQYRAGERVVLQAHVPSHSGPSDFGALMRHAAHVSVTPKTVLNFAFLRVALDLNPQLGGILTGQENWWGLKTLPYSYLRPLVGTMRSAAPHMLTRVYDRGIPVEYVRRLPFFDEGDYYRVYDAGVDPEYTRQFMVPAPGADLESSHVSFSAPIDSILQGWQNGIPADYLKETVTS